MLAQSNNTTSERTGSAFVTGSKAAVLPEAEWLAAVDANQAVAVETHREELECQAAAVASLAVQAARSAVAVGLDSVVAFRVAFPAVCRGAESRDWADPVLPLGLLEMRCSLAANDS
jgi:hypothetical protein